MIFHKKLKVNLAKLPREIGQEALLHFNSNFQKQAFDGVPWQMRKSGDATRNLLVSSGALRRSLRLSHATWRRISIASDMPYAQTHNEGGKIPITAKSRKYFWARYYASGKKESYWKGMALTKKDGFTIPKRQFAGMDRELERKIEQRFYRVFQKTFR